MIIAICGKSGSGKSTLSNIIMKKYKNCIHIDIDKIGHDIYNNKEVLENVIDSFGIDIIINNEIDRNKLSNYVFQDREKMQALENITWPYMKKIIEDIIANNQGKIIILDWLLLPKTDFFSLCDLKILLDIPFNERIFRCMKRDNITKDMFLLRDNAAIEYNYKDFDLIINEDLEMDKVFPLIKSKMK